MNPDRDMTDAASDPLGSRQASALPSTAVMDLDALLERCMGNIDFLVRIVDKFQSRIPEELDELEQAVDLQDAKRIASLAHRIKGESASASADGLQRVAREIEELGAAGRVGEIPARMTELRGEWTKYREHSACQLAAFGAK